MGCLYLVKHECVPYHPPSMIRLWPILLFFCMPASYLRTSHINICLIYDICIYLNSLRGREKDKRGSERVHMSEHASREPGTQPRCCLCVTGTFLLGPCHLLPPRVCVIRTLDWGVRARCQARTPVWDTIQCLTQRHSYLAQCPPVPSLLEANLRHHIILLACVCWDIHTIGKEKETLASS